MSKHRSNTRGYQFGDSGTRIVQWVGDPPEQVFGGGAPYASRKKYNFVSKPIRHVDYRDLPCLVKDAGRDNLKDLGEGTTRVEGVAFNPFEKLERKPRAKTGGEK